MNTMEHYAEVCSAAAAQVTRRYSTSFSIGIRLLAPPLRPAIHAIYAFVRCADEIVDTFHQYDRRALLTRFRQDTEMALAEGISLNPVLHGFQAAVRRHGIDQASIDAFLDSMAMDLDANTHDRTSFERYIGGSAEAVGLMCLRVFCSGDDTAYQRLKPFAQRLGAAFQKINFLRDLHDDHVALGRSYFPGVDPTRVGTAQRRAIEAEITEDLREALEGIRRLPRGARLGVYVAYVYYAMLFRKIQALPWERLCAERVRVHNGAKLVLLTTSYVKHSLGLIRPPHAER